MLITEAVDDSKARAEKVENIKLEKKETDLSLFLYFKKKKKKCDAVRGGCSKKSQ